MTWGSSGSDPFGIGTAALIVALRDAADRIEADPNALRDWHLSKRPHGAHPRLMRIVVVVRLNAQKG